MSPLKQSNNIAARMGRWSASHWKTAVFGWIAFVIVAVVAGSALGTKQIDQRDANVGQAHRADEILKKAGFQADPQTEIVLIQSRTQTIHDAAFRATVADAVATVEPFSARFKNLRSPLLAANAEQVSADGHTAMLEFDMRGKEADAEKHIEPITAATGKIAARHPGFFVGEAGSISSGKALNDAFNSQLAKAGERSVPLTLLILLLVFGSLVAAGLPLLLALSAVAATLGLVSLPSHLVPMDPNVSAVLLLVGLAVGVDYSLFYLKRDREERASGRSPRAALEAAAATSGRAVLISGLTVMIAMAGMLFSGDKTYLSFGIATMIVVAVAVLGSLTVLPALIARLGDKVDRGRIPFVHRLRREGGENRFWSAILTPALRHPVATVALSVGLLVALAVPALRIHTAQTGLNALPRNIATIPALDRIQSAFPGGATPALVAIQADADSPAVKHAVAQLRSEALASGQMIGPIDVDVNAGHSVTRVAIPLRGNGTDGTSLAALRTLRNDVLPATVGKVAGATYAVTGGTAASADENTLLKHSAPLVFGFVLTFAFALLLVSFRSLVIAAKAIVLNLLSVGAAYGVLVIVFQWGWGENLLNFTSNGGIAQWLPIFMFVILFGLSMDYHVFILSRIREAYDRGMRTEDAIAHGIKSTAGVVTSAALVMVGVFSIFATLPILDMKELGIGLAAAVLIDATIVRALLLPATMKLLGEWNWYLPSWLDWLPRLDHGAGSSIGAPVPEGA
ncbi:MAG TPA: MMPL family transporter [Gaiellaceae bacterium]|jgi:RND superfamily putative drug exporter|nr:MMPL family transporter [Gaiellaceae bacterium]